MAKLLLLALTVLTARAENWPMFRGPDARGAAAGNVPVSWNADRAAGPLRGVKWKTAIPGLAHSSAVVWGDRVYVTTAVSSAGAAPLKVGLYGSGDSADDNASQRWTLYALDKKTGRIVWERTAHEGVPRAKRHTKATHANSTAAVDGRRIVAYFGSEGVHSYSLDGKLLWKKDLGVFDVGPQGYDYQWGTASSPVLFEDKVILQCDQKKGSFLVVLSAATGDEVWRVDRDGVSNHSWATPAVIRASGRTQVVCNGWPYIAAYDFATGKELWRLKSTGDIPVPTPVLAHGLIFVTNAHGPGAPLYAILPGAAGDITPPEGSRTSAGVVWSEPRNGAYMQTPLIVGDILYSCSDRGVLKAYDARKGTLLYTQRLGEGATGFSSSPVAAGSRLYFASEEGEVYVVRAGATFELLAKNLLGEIAMASPAASDGVLFYRTRSHVVAIGE